MSLTATLYNFDIDLTDQDRGVYETLALRVARHPSESEEYLWTRILAYCLEFTEGIDFSHGGLSLAPHLNRRVAFAVSVMDRELYLAIGSGTFTSQITRHSLL